jgi:EmrB/QacA subfamily drug resistance transporter
LQYRWQVLTVTTVGIFMSSFDASVVVVGLPTVLKELGADLALGSWVITIYRLTLTALLAPLGKLSDMYGRVKFYSLGYLIFGLSSLLCALSSNIAQLLAFRLLQGIGAAFLFVNSMAIVTDAFAGRGLGTGIGVNQVAINAGTVAGYTLSGVLISLYGWRSIFWVNVPIGLLGFAWARLRLKELSERGRGGGFDVKGAATFSAALALSLVALTLGDIASPRVLSMLLASALLFVAFALLERGRPDPAIDLALFRIRTFTIAVLSNLLNGVSFASLAFIMALYLQLVRGLTPLQAGIALVPLDLTLICVGPLSGWLSDRYGAKLFSTLGLTVTGIALALLSGLDVDTAHAYILFALALAGLGIGLFRSPNASSAMGSVPSWERGIAAGIRSTVINSSTALSVPLSIALMTLALPYSELIGIVQAGAQVPAGELPRFLQGLRTSLAASAALNFAAALISLLREAPSRPGSGEPRGPSASPLRAS